MTLLGNWKDNFSSSYFERVFAELNVNVPTLTMCIQQQKRIFRIYCGTMRIDTAWKAIQFVLLQHEVSTFTLENLETMSLPQQHNDPFAFSLVHRFRF